MDDADKNRYNDEKKVLAHRHIDSGVIFTLESDCEAQNSVGLEFGPQKQDDCPKNLLMIFSRMKNLNFTDIGLWDINS